MHSTRTIRLAVLGVAMLLLAAACGSEDNSTSGGGGGDGGGGGTLVAAVPEDFDAIDPHIGSGETPAVWLSLVFETLVGVDADAEAVPGLAESWEVSDDDLTYTFTLREGVTFHDGTPLTSEAVKFSLERVIDPDTGAVSQSALAVIETIDTPDDRTVVLNLNTPSGSLLNDLAQQGRAAIVMPDDFDADGQLVDHIGTGPFTFESYTVNDRLVLARYDDYRDGAAELEGIEVRIIPDDTARLSALSSGEVQMAWNIPPEEAQPLADEGAIDMQEIRQNRGNFFSFNTTKAPFDDPLVREALATAVSRDDLVEAAWGGYAEATLQPFEEASPWYFDEPEVPEGDIDAARALLDEAGVDDLSVTILQWDALGSDEEAQLVASAWGELGVDVDVEKIDIGTLVDRATTGDFDVVYLWVGQILDPSRPYGFFESDSARNGLTGLFGSPELDATLEAALAETDVEARRELYRQVFDTNLEAFAQNYTVRPLQFVGLSSEVSGYEQGAYYVFNTDGGITELTLGEG